MFRSVAAFELRYQLKSPAFWVTFAIFLLLTFGARSDPAATSGRIRPSPSRRR
jgi:ABC-2 type transport system permease protein